MKTLRRCLVGILIVLLAMASTVGTARAGEGDEHERIDILKVLDEARAAEASTQSEGERIVQVAREGGNQKGVSSILISAVRESETKSDEYQKAFDEELERCMAAAGSETRKAQNECARSARQAGRAADASFTEEGGIFDDPGGNPNGDSIDRWT